MRGSTEIVTEFFGYSINSILYQRGIYPPETFARVQKYGLSMLVTTDEGLKGYLSSVLAQLSHWLVKGECQKVVIAISGVETNETLERWTFNVETDNAVVDGESKPKQKTQGDIVKEIQSIIRQIVSSVTFLPLLSEPCTFDMLVYANKEAEVPRSWEESDPKYIANSAEVRLRSFTTKVHKVDAMVAYKQADDDDV